MKLLERIIQSFAPSTRYIPVVGDLPPGLATKMRQTGLSPCHNARLVTGPSGGASLNCWCEKCHARYNVVVDYPVDWGECTDIKDDQGFNYEIGVTS